MSAELWATYSVRDHLAPGSFLPDVVMYDRLVVPQPPADEPAEWGRWEEQGWDPRRQKELLAVLGPVVERVDWNEDRRKHWERTYLASRRETSSLLTRGLKYELSAAQLFDRVPAMADRVVATSPYRSLNELTADLGIQRTDAVHRLPAPTVSAVVGRDLMLPQDDSRSETDLLAEAVREVAKNPDYRNARASLHSRLAQFSRNGFTDLESVKAAVNAIDGDVENMRQAVRKRRIWVTAGRLFTFSQIVLGFLAAPVAPLAVGAVVAALGGWSVTGFLSDTNDPARRAPDIAMLLEVRRGLRLG